MTEFSNHIKAYAVQNFLEYGKADAGKVMPKLFQHGLTKEKIKEVMPEIQQIVKTVNVLKKPDAIKLMDSLKEFIKETREERVGLPELDVQGLKKVVTRMAPEPSKYLHLGHAMTFLINYLYAEKYKGKCLLRFEDANPEKVSQEYIDSIIEDLEDYLGLKLAKPKYVSDDMPKFYKYAEKLIKDGEAYVCFCEREKMQNMRHDGVECQCRQFPVKIQTERWKDFVKGKYSEGNAVMRLKGDMLSLNHVMRDPVLFRRVDAKHYRHGTKYKVWPLYDFYNPIEDEIMGVTLILRSNEFETRVELQDKLRKLLGLKEQRIFQYGRFNVENFTTKGREMRELIESGTLMGWDDPRLITLKALKRRGIVKEAFYELARHIGLSKHPVNLQFDMIASINRKLIDSVANRYAFIQDPIKIEFDKPLPIKSVNVPIHPDKQETREMIIGEVFVSKKDIQEYNGTEIRLLHLCNVKLGNKTKVTSIENKKIPKIQWVSENVKTRVLMPDGKWIEGLVEKSASELKKNSVIQFERFGFVRFDGKNKDFLEFWYSHS